MKVFGPIIFLMWIAKAYMSLKKPYEVRVLSWRSAGTLLDCKFRVLGRDHRINGTLYVQEDITDDRFTFGAETYLDSFGSGNYKLLPYSISDGKACQTVVTFRKVFIPTLEFGVNTNIPIKSLTDPIPKGLYYVKDVLVKPDNWPLIVPRGFMKIVLSFHKDKQLVSTQEVDIQIVDRTV